MITVLGTRKGGAGKSTIAVNLAAYRKKQNKDVCLVDCDDQLSTTRWNERRSEGGLKPVIPIVNALGRRVGETLKEQSDRYADLVVDVPGRDSDELGLSMVVCDVFAIPLKISMFDLWALEKDIEKIGTLQMQRSAIGLPFRPIIFFNEVSTLPSVRDKQLDQMSQELLKFAAQIQEYQIEICPAFLSDREAYKKILHEGKSVFELGTENPSDIKAQEEIIGLYEYIYRGD